MTEALHRINLELRKLAAERISDRETIAAQALQINSLREEVKRLTADVARASYTKRAPLPATRTGRCGDDR